MLKLIDRLERDGFLEKDEFVCLIKNRSDESFLELSRRASRLRERYYGKDVYLRGLIEYTSYCKNDCYYCGIRGSNADAQRYRLSEDEILSCCEEGYLIGYRTFVLQGGEDPWFDDERLCRIVYSIKKKYADCAVTLSSGERSYESYRRLREAGADRYLLRHETADPVHYGRLHPPSLSFENRLECLSNLKELGFQVGTGFMVGSPFQTPESLALDLQFIARLRPHMVGIGPFIPHKRTPFSNMEGGTAALTLFLISTLRVMLPHLLLPATTALGTLDEHGREKGILAGANVIMPNLSPMEAREKYMIYDGKKSTGSESAEYQKQIEKSLSSIGYRVSMGRGDCRYEEKSK